MDNKVDLNKSLISVENSGCIEPLKNLNCASKNGDIEVYFKNIEEELIKKINNADIILGCVAWFTNEKILRALAKKDGVSIIVQKEDFLRPDIGKQDNWRYHLNDLYCSLKGLCRYDEGLNGSTICCMSSAGDPALDPIRCVGNHNSDKKPAFPRMHNKFIIFCVKIPSSGDFEENNYFKYAVWTGSFNFTKNASNSFENALYVTDQNIVNAYFEEYGQIAALSEPLNWEHDWIEPEFRIGT